MQFGPEIIFVWRLSFGGDCIGAAVWIFFGRARLRHENRAGPGYNTGNDIEKQARAPHGSSARGRGSKGKTGGLRQPHGPGPARE